MVTKKALFGNGFTSRNPNNSSPRLYFESGQSTLPSRLKRRDTPVRVWLLTPLGFSGEAACLPAGCEPRGDRRTLS